jgi:hypothetical protein
MSVITRLPLSRLTTPRGDAQRIGDADRECIRNLLRAGTVRFVIADVGLPLDWVPEPECFDVWKKEVQRHLAEPGERIRLEEYPGEYAYFASQWEDGSTPIIVLSKAH